MVIDDEDLTMRVRMGMPTMLMKGVQDRRRIK